MNTFRKLPTRSLWSLLAGAWFALVAIFALPASAALLPTYDFSKTVGTSGAPNVLIYGKTSGDELGRIVRVGDVNGDGIDDLIVATTFADVGSPNRADAGAVYIWFGKSTVAGTKDAAGTSGTAPDVVIYGAAANDQLTRGGGLAVGDVNGDGVDDIVIGGVLNDGPGGTRVDCGAVYVIFGRKSPSTFPATLDMAIQGAGGADVTVYGAVAGDQLSDTGSITLGDVNGDGVKDIIVGSYLSSGPGGARLNAGAAYVIFGRKSPSTFPTSLDMAIQGAGGADVTLYGATAGDFFCYQNAIAVGDVNGDGVADLIIGADRANGPSGTRADAGGAYVMFGRKSPATFPTIIDMAVQGTGGPDSVIYGAKAGEKATAGATLLVADVNGDGVPDIIIGAGSASGPGGARPGGGEVYVVFGRKSPTPFPATLDLAVQGSSGADVTFYGTASNDNFGKSITTGDFNGDGVADILVGAPAFDGPGGTRVDAGAAYLFFGHKSPSTFPVTLDTATSSADVTIYGAVANDQLTSSLVQGAMNAGDLNGDGIKDIVLGARFSGGAGGARPTSGAAYIIFGRNTFPASLDMAVQGSSGADVTIYGPTSGDELSDGDGGNLGVGDFNHDGIPDLLIGARNASGPSGTRSGAGQAYVLFGVNSADISIEQPVGTTIASGSTKDFGTTVLGTPLNLTFTLKNTGTGEALAGLTLTKDGADAAQFLITGSPASSVPIGGNTTFTVQFAPTASGAKTAALHIASNVVSKSPYNITLTGRGLSTTDDTDGDGMNDAAEFLLSSLGFNWQVSQPALVNAYYTNANAAGLFTQAQCNAMRTTGQNDVLNSPGTYNLYSQAQLQALNVGAPMLSKDPNSGQFKLTIEIDRSTDLIHFSPFPMTAPQATVNAQGQLEFQFTVPDNTAFFKVQSK